MATGAVAVHSTIQRIVSQTAYRDIGVFLTSDQHRASSTCCPFLASGEPIMPSEPIIVCGSAPVFEKYTSQAQGPTGLVTVYWARCYYCGTRFVMGSPEVPPDHHCIQSQRTFL